MNPRLLQKLCRIVFLQVNLQEKLNFHNNFESKVQCLIIIG
jgi:hypothetical protein